MKDQEARAHWQQVMDGYEDTGADMAPSRRFGERERPRDDAEPSRAAPHLREAQRPLSLYERLQMTERQAEYFRELAYRLTAENERLSKQQVAVNHVVKILRRSLAQYMPGDDPSRALRAMAR